MSTLVRLNYLFFESSSKVTNQEEPCSPQEIYYLSCILTCIRKFQVLLSKKSCRLDNVLKTFITIVYAKDTQQNIFCLTDTLYLYFFVDNQLTEDSH